VSGESPGSPRTVRALRGTVVEGAFAPGSKSARPAQFLQTGDERYVLRRRAGPSYGDAALARFVGHTVECDGTVTSYVLLLDRIEAID
jgi:hypothetical protein